MPLRTIPAGGHFTFIRLIIQKLYLMSTNTTQLPSATTTTDPTKLCSITNNSGVDIVITMPLTSDETPDAGSIVTFNKDVEIPQAAKGGNVITNGTTDSVTLNRTAPDPDTKEPFYETLYDLWPSTANWYCPINNVSAERDRRTKKFPAITVSTDDVTVMKETVSFYQTISANPNTKLAQDYVTAANASDPSDSDDSTSPIAEFFAGTKSYTHVTMASVVAVEAYYESFVFGWANYGSLTYYLYSSDGNTTSFQGTMVLTQPATIDNTLANSGYTCQFVPAVAPTDTTKVDVDTSKAVSLTFSDGLFVDDTTSDIPDIALKGSFQLRRTFSKVSTDKTIIPVMSGNINGAVCLGFDESQLTKPGESDTQQWLDSLFNPKGAAQIFNSVMQILGALMMLHFIGTLFYSIGKWIYNKATGTKPATPDDIVKQLKEMRDEQKAQKDAEFKKASGDKNAEVPEDSSAAVSKATTERAALSDQVGYSKAETTLDKVDANLSKMEKFTAKNKDLNLEVEDAGNKLGDISDKLDTVTPENLSEVMQDVRTQLSDLTSTVKQLNVDVQKIVADTQKAEVQKDIDEMNDVNDAVEEEKTTTENENGDPENGDPDGDPVEFPDL
ncbi:MAG: hypothetical protein INR73_25875 [Williamsia sp.]|nr:hypothetical protein [Williamsia sp.]